MRYISKYYDLAIKREDGTTAYQFNNGVLVVGSLTTASGAGNFIDPNDSATDGTKVQELATGTAFWAATPGSPTDTEQIGLGLTFFESPVLSAGDNMTVGDWYNVLTGTITETTGGLVYTAPARFQSASVEFTGSGATVARAIQPEHYRELEHNQREYHFIINNLGLGTEGAWSDATWIPTGRASILTVQ